MLYFLLPLLFLLIGWRLLPGFSALAVLWPLVGLASFGSKLQLFYTNYLNILIRAATSCGRVWRHSLVCLFLIFSWNVFICDITTIYVSLFKLHLMQKYYIISFDCFMIIFMTFKPLYCRYMINLLINPWRKSYSILWNTSGEPQEFLWYPCGACV